MKLLLSVLAILGLAVAAFGQPLVISFAPAEGAATEAGHEISLDLLAANRSGYAIEFTASATLAAQLRSGDHTWSVELRADPSVTLVNGSIAPGTFARIRYFVVLPADANGAALLESRLPDGTVARGWLETGETLTSSKLLSPPPNIPDESSSAANSKPTTTLVRAEPAASVIQRTFANRLAPHEPIYFIYGPDSPAAKFQFSFKYRLLNFTELSRENMSRTLQFAFTQRSLWDIAADSSPFYDTSYMPELIFESLAPRPEDKDTWFTWLGYQAAFKHESNGRDGPVSRSLNTAYLRGAIALGNLEGWHLFVIPEVWTYVTSLEDNSTLKDYRGYGQLRLAAGRNNGPSLMASLWAGKDFNHGSMQLDFTLPVRTKLLNFETYLLIQYFNGYGESLLYYTQKSETVRAGISLVR